jgi:hypothetical protein
VAAAIVAAVRSSEVPGSRRWGIFDFTFSTSYPAGGEPMTASLFGFLSVDAVIPMGASRASAEVIPVFKRSSGTLELYTSSTGALVATSSDQSSNTVTILVLGI